MIKEASPFPGWAALALRRRRQVSAMRTPLRRSVPSPRSDRGQDAPTGRFLGQCSRRQGQITRPPRLNRRLFERRRSAAAPDRAPGNDRQSPSERRAEMSAFTTKARIITMIGNVSLLQRDAMTAGGRIDLDSGPP